MSVSKYVIEFCKITGHHCLDNSLLTWQLRQCLQFQILFHGIYFHFTKAWIHILIRPTQNSPVRKISDRNTNIRRQSANHVNWKSQNGSKTRFESFPFLGIITVKFHSKIPKTDSSREMRKLPTFVYFYQLENR